MAIIQFENGKKVQFDGTPTEKDIEEVAQKLGISKKKSLARKVGDFFTSSSQKFGQTLGTAASVIDPKTKKIREETLASSQKMAEDYIQRAKQEPDKEKAKKFLEAAKKISDTDDLDIFTRPEYQKTAKQVFGEGLGTFLEVASFSSLGGAGKSFQLGKASVPTIVKPLTKSGSILQATKQGAAVGSAYGSAFGVSEAMMNNKSIGGIIQEGLISGAGGALLGGALGGATTATFQGISGLLSRASNLTQKGRSMLSKAVTQKLEQTARDLVKMSPTATKNETKWNKNTPNFIANEFVIDEKTLKPKSILQLIDSDGKRIDTTEAINALRSKYREESRAFNSLIKDSGEYASFNQLRDKTIRTIGDDYKTKGSDYEDALKYINKEIDAYKRNYRQAGLIEGDDVLIPISEMSRIKSGLWDKTSNFNPSQADKLLSDLNYRMGHTAKDLIEESVEDVAVKRMNQRLGDFASAIKVLDNAQGKVLPGGFFGRQFTRLAGTVAGSPGGVGGSIVGNITGGVLADIMVDPKIKTAIWTKLYQSLNKTVKGKSIIDEAIEILKKRGQERASRKLLEAPKFIPLGPKKDNSRLFTQDEANALLESLKKKDKPLLLKAPLGDKTNPIILPKAKGQILKSTPLKSLEQEAKKYKTTINIQDKNDLEYLRRILSEDNIKDIQSGKMVNFRGTPYEDIARVNLISETPKTIEQQLAGKIKEVKLKSDTFYHGTSAKNARGIMKTGFKSGSELPEETFRGGGYGKMQSSISLTETPKDASRFSTLTKNGEIVEAKLKPNSKVVSIEGVEDAVELEDYISYLKKQKVDAVYIGGGEKELVVINPKAITPTKSQLTDIWKKANKK